MLVTQQPPPMGGTTIRALLLDDSDFDRQRIRRFSERSKMSMDIHEVPSLADMRDSLRHSDFDVILIDYNLAEGDGLDAMEQIHSSASNQDAAVVMITGQSQTSLAVNAFRRGCDDFVIKDDLTPVVFEQAVMGALENSAQRRQQHAIEILKPVMQEVLEHSLNKGNFGLALKEAVSAVLREQMPSQTADQVGALDGFLDEFLREDEFYFSG